MGTELSHRDKVAILSRLVKCAVRIGKRIETIEREYNLDQLASMIKYLGLKDQHQTNEFDGTAYTLSLDEIEDVFDRKPGRTPFHIPFNTRFQHKKEVHKEEKETPYWLLSGPNDGNTNLMDSLEDKIALLRKGMSMDVNQFNPDTCVTLAFIDEREPWKPIATAIYYFRNHTVYSSLQGEGGNYMAFRGEGLHFVLPEEELLRFKQKGLFKVFIADYVNDFKAGPEALEESLVAHGRKFGLKIQTVRGSPASSPNMVQVFDLKTAIGYICGRAEWQAGDEVLKKMGGDYAVLLYTNVIATIPIALGYGMEITDVHYNDLSKGGKINLADIKSNPKISLCMVPPPEYYPLIEGAGQRFTIRDGLAEGLQRAQELWQNILSQKGNKSH